MKRRLNVLCIVMLTLLLIQVILSFAFSIDDMISGFSDGYKDGQASTIGKTEALCALPICIAVIYLSIHSFVSFVKFILNVNRDKVFVVKNVSLLRSTGWRLLIAIALCIPMELILMGTKLDTVFDEYVDPILFSVFCLIIAEVFAIGLKLKEEQDLTI